MTYLDSRIAPPTIAKGRKAYSPERLEKLFRELGKGG